MAIKNEMRRWIAKATEAELAELAELAETTKGTLRQVAGCYRTEGVAVASAGLATKIELATKTMVRPGLPRVLRGDLCAACAGCDLYKKAKK